MWLAFIDSEIVMWLSELRDIENLSLQPPLQTMNEFILRFGNGCERRLRSAKEWDFNREYTI